MSTIDLSEFEDAGAQAPADKLEALSKMLSLAVRAEQAIENMEEDLKALRKSYETLRSKSIPDLMSEVGMTKTEYDGWSVKIQDVVSGSLPKADLEARQRAINWLKANGGEELIKSTISLSFGKGEDNYATDLYESLKEQGYEPVMENGVHPQTLAAFAREKLKKGEPIDTELLGLYTGKVAKIDRVKQK